MYWLEFSSVGMMPRIYQLMYAVSCTRSTARLSTIMNQVSGCRCPIHKYRDTRRCTGLACLVAIFNGEALTGFTCEGEIGSSNELLEKLGPALLSSKLAPGRCVPALASTEIKTLYFGF